MSSVKDGSRNLPLNFGQHLVSNSWDIPIFFVSLVGWWWWGFQVKPSGCVEVVLGFRQFIICTILIRGFFSSIRVYIISIRKLTLITLDFHLSFNAICNQHECVQLIDCSSAKAEKTCFQFVKCVSTSLPFEWLRIIPHI